MKSGFENHWISHLHNYLVTYIRPENIGHAYYKVLSSLNVSVCDLSLNAWSYHRVGGPPLQLHKYGCYLQRSGGLFLKF